MTTKTKNNDVSFIYTKEFKESIENVFSNILCVGVCYEDLIIKDNTSDSKLNINSWVKAYNEYGVSTMCRAWSDEINKPDYDLEEFNCFGVFGFSGTYFEIRNTYYNSKLIKNNKIKRLLSGCSEKTKQTADVYIIEIGSKIYIHIDKY